MRTIVAVFLLTSVSLCFADQLSEPPVFTSHNHKLDLIMVAKARTISLGGFHPEAWVYEICPRSSVNKNSCSSGAQTVSPYGGVRLQLEPGDHLRIHFVNELPPAPDDAEHVRDNEMESEMLAANPTNLHTHGLIVEPRRAGNGDPTYGDFIYVLGYPAGEKPSMQHPGLDYTDQPINYDIFIPFNHPAGLFWFHPHVHGLALNQVSKGLAGIITVGSPQDYLGDRPGHLGISGSYRIRHLTLKDIQVEPNGSVLSQEDPNFCLGQAASGELVRSGFCAGQSYTDDDGLHDHTGGQWFFSVNGQVFPTIKVGRSTGELWRFTNASGSRGYDLSLLDDATHQPLQMQLISIDGVSLNVPAGSDIRALASQFGGKLTPQACAGPRMSGRKNEPVCATKIRMMPSSRMEIWVSPGAALSGSATLVTDDVRTGDDADDWPASNLARVVFEGGKASGAFRGIEVHGKASQMLRSDGVLGNPAFVSFGGVSHAIPMDVAQALAAGKMSRGDQRLAGLVGDTSAKELQRLTPAQFQNLSKQVSALQDNNCKALPPGHKRRIFFGTPASDPDAFGLGYEEVDQNNNPVPGTFQDVTEFDHTMINVCLPLEHHNRPVTEHWELINVANEDHNFHIHQTKFKVLAEGAPDGDANALMDNVPLFHGSQGCDGSVESWRSGSCQVKAVHTAIPFSQIGDFVYHCHILEHEDGGMMAHIRVVANP